ncbi:MAG: hypothetical protein AAGU27_16275 [Dehalobacterium sp.]
MFQIWILAPLVKKMKAEEDEKVIITGFRPSLFSVMRTPMGKR